MAWETRVDGKWHSSDDLTLDELDVVEKASGIGWGFLNPIRNAATARTLLALWYVKEGRTDEEAKAAIAALTNKTLKVTFRYVDDDDLPEEWEDGLPVPDPKDQGAPSTATS